MKASDWAWGIAVVLAAIAGVAFYLWRSDQPAAPPTAQAPSQPPSMPRPATEPPPPVEPEHPVPEPPAAAEPPPTLADSDARLAAELRPLLGDTPLEAVLVPKELIRRFVVTVDNLPRESLPQRLRVFAPVAGRPPVRRDGDRLYLDPEQNAPRYAGFVAVLQRVDAATLAQLYFRYYGLCQQAYAEMGFRGRHFNDRLVQVIDHLLATPTVAGAVEVRQPRALYVFADPALESLSVGQKALIRMGSQAQPVKDKLRELRAHIARGRAPAE